MSSNERIILINTKPGHNKYYILEPVKSDNDYVVKYGAIGREATRVIYSNSKKSRISVKAQKVAKGYTEIKGFPFGIGDIVTVSKSEGTKEAFVIDNFWTGMQILRVQYNDGSTEDVFQRMISMVRKVDNEDNSLYKITLPFLMDAREDFMRKEGYLE